MSAYLIYGAYGYTGTLIAQQAVARGHEPILSGRNEQKVNRLAAELDLPAQPTSLTDGFRLRSVLEEVEAVIHCAGPFVDTAWPMVEACLDAGTHYLDITGEATVFDGLMARSPDAEATDVMLVPGIGFDVVPTDCLAKGLVEEVPSATELEIAFLGKGGISQGTLKTAVRQMGMGGMVRREGEVVEVPAGWATRTVDFGDHPRTVISIPWGDVITSGHSTGIPNVTVYTYMPKMGRRLLRLSRYLQGVLGWKPLQMLLQRVVERWVPNPSPEMREKGSTRVWASVRDGKGRETVARLAGPEPYTFTARTAVQAAERVMEGTAPSGYQTPSTAFGHDFVFDIDGVERLSGDR
mgnify:CR=1 FL=1